MVSKAVTRSQNSHPLEFGKKGMKKGGSVGGFKRKKGLPQGKTWGVYLERLRNSVQAKPLVGRGVGGQIVRLPLLVEKGGRHYFSGGLLHNPKKSEESKGLKGRLKYLFTKRA